MARIISYDDVVVWLKNNAPHIKLIYWSGNSSKDKSLFQDSNRNIQFSRCFNTLKKQLKKNPDIIFNPSKEELKNVQQKGMIKKYGTSNSMKVPEIKNKFKTTMLQRYGVEYSAQSEELLSKTKKTIKEKYGVENVFQHKSTLKKIKRKEIETKKNNGYIKTFNNKNIEQLSQKCGFSFSHFNKLVNKFGIEKAINLTPRESVLEQVVQSFLKDENIKYITRKKLKETHYYPDILIPDYKLIIECDGLWAHCDKNKDTIWSSNASNDFLYHKKKKETYENLGYDSLFFREDEIINKFNITESLIRNKLNKINKIYGRKTKIISLKKNIFFEQNHLMGKGSGRTCALTYNNELVSAIQVKWKNKQKGILEISRFCNKLNTTVVGGFSKLVKHIIKKEKPKQIITFVDKRYGNGNSLKNLKFKLINNDVSFQWTDTKETFHRMKFPGNTGYDNGCYKIWDCGQAKYVLNVND